MEENAKMANKQEPIVKEKKEEPKCYICVGLSVYNRALSEMREKPKCRGLEVPLKIASDENWNKLLQRRRPVPDSNFTIIGIGLTFYEDDWMKEGKYLPITNGWALHVLRNNDEEYKKKLLQKKIEREQQEDEGRDVDESSNEDDQAAAISLANPPFVNPPNIQKTFQTAPNISLEDLMSRSLENSKYAVNAMYNFWSRRLDGFGERYVASCERLLNQMDKQLKNIPKTFDRIYQEIQDQTRGKK